MNEVNAVKHILQLFVEKAISDLEYRSDAEDLLPIVEGKVSIQVTDQVGRTISAEFDFDTKDTDNFGYLGGSQGKTGFKGYLALLANKLSK